MLPLPYRMETTFARYPYTNAAIIAVTSIFYFFVELNVIPQDTAELFVLQDWDIGQMIGNLLMHGDILHLVGNMLFLWIFGNAICALVGNLSYFFVYIFFGICASASHMFFNGNPAIGASGAINGIIGMSLIFFPVNKLHLFYFFTWPFSFPHVFKAGKVVVKSFWMIALWFVYDIFGLLSSENGIAYWAHIGGFASGLLMALVLSKSKMFETYDATLFDVIDGNAEDRGLTTFEELEEKNRRKKSQSESFDEIPLLEMNTISVDHSEPSLSFRILNMTRKENGMMCYFINDGDAIDNIAIHSPLHIEIQPSRLEKRGSGWIRFAQLDHMSEEQIHFTLSCSAGGQPFSQEMKLDAKGKKFTAAV